MTNEKNPKIKFDKAVFLYAYVFLLLPVIIFFCTWTKLYIGIPISVFSLAGFFIVLKAKRKYKDIFESGYKKS